MATAIREDHHQNCHSNSKLANISSTRKKCSSSRKQSHQRQRIERNQKEAARTKRNTNAYKELRNILTAKGDKDDHTKKIVKIQILQSALKYIEDLEMIRKQIQSGSISIQENHGGNV